MPLAHGPLLTVQTRSKMPMPMFVTVVFGSVGSVMVPVPFRIVHRPLAGKVIELPASVALVTGVQIC